MKTFLEICKYTSNMTNSELGEVNSLADVTDEQKNAFNRALLFIWNALFKSDIKFAKTSFNSVVGQENYPMVNGNIIENGVKYNGKLLELELSPELLDVSNGTPTKFYIQGNEIILHPVPQEEKTVNVKYRNKYAVKTASGVEQSRLINTTDVLNISERVEEEFIECLGDLTNELLNADSTDEDYLEHSTRAKLALSILKQSDTGTEGTTASFIL